MPSLFKAVAPPPGVAGIALIEKFGNLYVHWQKADGTVSESYAMWFELAPDGSGVRAVLYDNNPPPEFQRAADGYFLVIHP